MYPKTSNWRVIAIFKTEPKEQLIMVSCSYAEARQNYVSAFADLIDLSRFSDVYTVELQQWEEGFRRNHGKWISKGTLRIPALHKILKITSPISS